MARILKSIRNLEYQFESNKKPARIYSDFKLSANDICKSVQEFS